MLTSGIQIIIFGLLLFFAAFLEYLDWYGRADVLKEKHPKVWAVMNSRPTRLVLLAAALAFLGRDFHDAIAIAPPPLLTVKPPIAPVLNVERPIIIQAPPNPEVERLLRRQDEELSKLKSQLPSPRKKALQLSNDILKFLADRMRNQPNLPMTRGSSDDWRRQMDEYSQLYEHWMRETAAEYQVNFGARVRSVMDDVEAAGLSAVAVQSCVWSNGNTFGIQECGARIGALADKFPQ